MSKAATHPTESISDEVLTRFKDVQRQQWAHFAPLEVMTPPAAARLVRHAGVKAGHSYGETDDFSYNVVDKPVHIHDLNATLLHCLGIDHERLTYRFQGRDFRLTDIHGTVVKDILA